MKKSKLLITLLASMLTVTSLVGCDNNTTENVKFDFTLKLESGASSLTVGGTDKVVPVSNKTNDTEERIYTYAVSGGGAVTIDKNTGDVEAIFASANVTFTVTETTSRIRKKLSVPVLSQYLAAEGGMNFSSAGTKNDIDRRTEILGSLEKYAMESHLTGITLFDNGGKVAYSNRIKRDNLPSEYITGFGFGILSDGEIDSSKPLAADATTDYKDYYHTASSSDPQTINQLNETGSQVMDLASYITSTYWGTKMDSNKTGYEWYPVLAKDTIKVDGVDVENLRPIPIYEGEPNPLGLYDTWRIYVKTSEIAYRCNSQLASLTEFDGRAVSIDDYAYIFKLLLTGANKQRRGAEMAGDNTYGIVGARTYYNKTKNIKDNAQGLKEIDDLWDEMTAEGAENELGIKTGHDNVNGDYIQFKLLNEIDSFTAMYTLSSNLYSPIPEDFIKAIGNGSMITGINRYGNVNNVSGVAGAGNILNFTLNLGPFYLEKWDNEQLQIFKRNDDWFEHTSQGRYKIPGVHIKVVKNATQNPVAIYNQFKDRNLDSCGIPVSKMEAYDSEIVQSSVGADIRETKGDSTFKLNINSCTQERWDELNEKVWKNASETWDVKPWMSNDDFLNGLFFAINRKEFAEKRGVTPSINYFSDAYLSNPERGESYNGTDAHKKAVEKYQVIVDGEDNFGYNPTKAINYFQKAVNTLVENGDIKYGTQANPKEMKISICWMYQSDIKDYGDDIVKYLTDAFNDPAVSQGRIKLVVEQEFVSNWEDVYNKRMMKGRFDLAFGAISGNSYNPLNFLEVLKSDNSSGFTLNWGTDTSKLDARHPLVYGEGATEQEIEANTREWSFDALWSVADHGGIVKNGEITDSVTSTYIEKATPIGSQETTFDIHDGAEITIPVNFADIESGVEFDVSSVQVYVLGYGNFNLSKQQGVTVNYDKDNHVVRITLTKEAANLINEQIRETFKLNKGDANDDPAPFVIGNYNKYWNFELYYTLSIQGGNPAQNYVTIGKNQEAWEAEKDK